MDYIPRVLFINHSIRDGGPGKSLFYILKFLDRTRVSPYVLIPKDDVFSERLKGEGLYENIITDKRFPENLKRPWFESGEGDGGGLRAYYGTVLHVLSVLLNIMDLFSLVVTSPFLIRRHRIDVIYCNGTQAKIVGAMMGLLNRRPVIWHVRNIQQTRLLGGIINACAALPAVRRIICVSGATAGQFRYGKKKLVVIHNGIDAADYDPGRTGGEIRSEYGLTESTVIVGSTGRIVPRKGYDLFIKSAGEAIKGLGDKGTNVRFVIVGDTPYFFKDDHMAYLQSLVTELSLEDYFIFTGFRKDVRPCLKDFDIFVIPSNYPDPFPRSVIEAMSFALPVIGFRVGGIVESVEDGVTGILNEPGSTGDMGRAILKLILDSKLRKAMGRAGRERVRSDFSADVIAQKIQEVILETAGSEG